MAVISVPTVMLEDSTPIEEKMFAAEWHPVFGCRTAQFNPCFLIPLKHTSQIMICINGLPGYT